MALQAQAQLLDELMGKFRNVAPGEKTGSIRFDDDDVCKHHLCGFCPHDLFVNTKADLGPCDKIHDDEMKRSYEKSSRFGKLGYEDDFERFLRSLLSDVEKKIKRGNERLKLTQSELSASHPLQAKQERLTELKEIINKLIREAESLGEEAKIEEAQEKLEECEKYKAECKVLEIGLNNLDQKQMEVCEVCGSFLIVNDAQARVEEHINGKQHMGYAKVKSTLEEIRLKRMKEYEEKEKKRELEREKRRETEKKRDETINSRKDRKRSRSRDRNRKSRSRSRSRHDRKRNYSNSRRHRTKSRSRSRERSSKKSHKRRDSSSHRKSINDSNIKEDGELKSEDENSNNSKQKL